jgi:hypothetical protein
MAHTKTFYFREKSHCRSTKHSNQYFEHMTESEHMDAYHGILLSAVTGHVPSPDRLNVE